MKNTWMEDYAQNIGYYAHEQHPTEPAPTVVLYEPEPWGIEDDPVPAAAFWWKFLAIGVAMVAGWLAVGAAAVWWW